ncbi:L-2-hydroxyglutarate oxidase [Flagellimonas sp. 2504JD1-5]
MTKPNQKLRKKRVAIIGGGITGLALGYKILAQSDNYSVQLFEKESSIGTHQSGNNSGVLHCGLYYKPNSLKARLAVSGIREMTIFCEKHSINHDLCGKVVVAVDEGQCETLDALAVRGKKNGLEGLRFLSPSELKKREPCVKAEKALLVPEEGIVDYKAVMNKMAELIKKQGGEIIVGTKIDKVMERKNVTTIFAKQGSSYEVDLLINCTGLFTDRMFQTLSGNTRPLRIVPFRGEYMMIKKEYDDIVNHLVYPVPDVKYPFLGVHFTRMIGGRKEIGPNAVLAFKREGYKNTDFSLKDTYDSLSYRGLHSFLANNFSFALKEFGSSLSMASFVRKAQKIVPELNINMIEKGNAGVRAQAMNDEGELIMDFKIEKQGNQVHLLNAPSPGATASLAIAQHIIDNYINI